MIQWFSDILNVYIEIECIHQTCNIALQAAGKLAEIMKFHNVSHTGLSLTDARYNVLCHLVVT